MSMICDALGLSRARPLQCYLMPLDVVAPGGLIHSEAGIETVRCGPDNASPTVQDNVLIPDHRSGLHSRVWALITAARIHMNSLIVSQALQTGIEVEYRRWVNSS